MALRLNELPLDKLDSTTSTIVIRDHYRMRGNAQGCQSICHYVILLSNELYRPCCATFPAASEARSSSVSHLGAGNLCPLSLQYRI